LLQLPKLPDHPAGFAQVAQDCVAWCQC
jgi:hypothetical protein